MRTLVVANDIRNGRGKLFGISRTFVRNFCAKNEIDLLRVSPIAKERAEQATPERRDAWFRCVEAYVRRLHAEGKVRPSPRRGLGPSPPPLSPTPFTTPLPGMLAPRPLLVAVPK